MIPPKLTLLKLMAVLLLNKDKVTVTMFIKKCDGSPPLDIILKGCLL